MAGARSLAPSSRLYPNDLFQTYSCDYSGCEMVFTRAYELKKHNAMHEDPDSVFRCSECEFITLQKKNLTIHFSQHTGEKLHECPDHVVDPSGSTHRCDFRTHDPAALSKHRKKVHDYIPPLNRRRGIRDAPACLRKTRVQKEENVARTRRRRPKRSAATSRIRPSRAACAGKNPAGAAPSNASCVPFVRVENVAGDVVDVDGYAESGCDAIGGPFIGDVDNVMQLDTLYDPSLHSDWMARYEEGYGAFDTGGMKYVPSPLHVASSVPVDVDVQTGREGCLCPEWMVEAGIEGWDQSVLETHNDFYAL